MMGAGRAARGKERGFSGGLMLPPRWLTVDEHRALSYVPEADKQPDKLRETKRGWRASPCLTSCALLQGHIWGSGVRLVQSAASTA